MPSRSALSSCLAHFPADFSLCGSLVRFINGFRNQNKKKNNLKRVFAQFFRCPAAITDQQSKISFLPALGGSFYFLVISARCRLGSRAQKKPPKRKNSKPRRVSRQWILGTHNWIGCACGTRFNSSQRERWSARSSRSEWMRETRYGGWLGSASRLRHVGLWGFLDNGTTKALKALWKMFEPKERSCFQEF